MINEKDVRAALPELAPGVKLTVKAHGSDYRLIQIYLQHTRPKDKSKAHATYVVKCVDDDYKDIALLKDAVKHLEQVTRPFGFFA